MTDLHMRPRFTRTLNGNVRYWQEQFEQAAAASDGAILCSSTNEHSVLRVANQERRIWSPQLSLDFRPEELGAITIYGRFEPSGGVWSTIAFFYALASIGALLALCWGGGQLLADKSPTAFWALVPLLLLSALVYGTAFVGRRLSRGELAVLGTFASSVLPTDSAEP